MLDYLTGIFMFSLHSRLYRVILVTEASLCPPAVFCKLLCEDSSSVMPADAVSAGQEAVMS